MDKERILQELNFQAVRSSGAGGQHVNKVSSKVVLQFNLDASKGLTEKEKGRIVQKLANRLTKENSLQLQCEESRSQHKNKELVIKRFFNLLTEALQVPKKRKKTKPSKAAIEKRLQSKKKAALKKISRQRPGTDQ
ncbi:alternative ribosome rescue aminoacyl-tRNA hydrolase ArfB [Muriicola sp. Z0-33]|uniref:alternative ribosome rescue aminoacyl-tRNA hydrolase ArfB n=1 Tax=Muriicola sp. Z0-33 TaxID=2816957 RepID=UPI002237A114|nr:alternative ribosome rescue aminoacyl-tRNA hydrolase ArfB [Muriicola sp. Z0-33]MCW5514789.1 aminoacyl-tRNA hydrolase [Muriicola sp. Z0-33]